MSAKLIVFLRAYNDVDHVVPILYKWLNSTDIPVEVVLTGPRRLRDDYRILFIGRQSGVRVRHIDTVHPGPEARDELFANHPPGPISRLKLRAKRKLEAMGLLQYVTERRAHKNAAGGKQIERSTKPDKSTWIRHGVEMRMPEARRLVADLMGDAASGVVAFDWNYSLDTRAIVRAARERGVTTLALPHGDRPFYNLMFYRNDINYHDGRMRSPEDCIVFDYTVVPNQLTAKQYARHPEPDHVKVLGSPRFNDEWLTVLEAILPEAQLPDAEGQLKLVLFLRDPGYPIHLEELATAIQLTLQFTGVSLVVKEHTRRREDVQPSDYLSVFRSHPRVKFVGDEVHSGSLLEWCDAVLDLATSISFEAVKKRIPVLALDYVHANYSTVARYFPSSSEMKCRDDLYDSLSRMLESGTENFYNPIEWKLFVEEMIEYPDFDVLQRYVDTLLELAGGNHSIATGRR